MASFNRRSFTLGALIWIASIITVPVSQAQSELSRFLEAADEARTQEKILLVYFHSSVLDHPREFLNMVSEEVRGSMDAHATHVDIDIATKGGRELADAFLNYGKLLPPDQLRPTLGIVPPHGRRAITILGGGIGQIQPDGWSRLLAQVAPIE